MHEQVYHSSQHMDFKIYLLHHVKMFLGIRMKNVTIVLFLCVMGGDSIEASLGNRDFPDEFME